MNSIGPVQSGFVSVNDEFDAGNDVEVPHNDEHSLIVYVKPPDRFVLYPRYFALNPEVVLSCRRLESIYIQVDGRRVKISGIGEEELDMEFEGIFERVVGKDELKAVLDQFQADRFLERTKHLFDDTLADRISPLKTHEISFLLGEEFYTQVVNRIPFKWQLPAENVIKFQKLIFEAQAKLFPSVSAEHEAISDQFREEKAHLIKDDTIPLLVSLMNQNIARVEKIRSALKGYFHIQKILLNMTDEIIDQVKALKKIVLSAERASRFEAQMRGYNEEERSVFLGILKLVESEENEDLMTPMDSEDGFDLSGFSWAAKNTLDRACFDVGLQINFRDQGREMSFGGTRASKPEDEFVHVSPRELSS